MFRYAFSNSDRVLRTEVELAPRFDHAEKASWPLLLHHLDYLEAERQEKAELKDGEYVRILNASCSWETWATPEAPDEKLDHEEALTRATLIDFVSGEFFPYLKRLAQTSDDRDSVNYKIGSSRPTPSGACSRSSTSSTSAAPRPCTNSPTSTRRASRGKAIPGGTAGILFIPPAHPRHYSGSRSAHRVDRLRRRLRLREVYVRGVERPEARRPLRPRIALAPALDLQWIGKKSSACALRVRRMTLHGTAVPCIRPANPLPENVMDIQKRDRNDVVRSKPLPFDQPFTLLRREKLSPIIEPDRQS